MAPIFRDRLPLPALLLLAGVLRLLGAFFLPNAFGDAYVYIQEIGSLSTRISLGSFRLTDLFGFWLPLYQLISASLNVFIRNGFYAGKIVAALFGAATCLLVYAVTWRLTHNRRAAFWMFVTIALNPLHIFYSASAMTDVPHAFFVLAALYFVITGNWTVAAILGALAGFTRVESWMLIAIIPFLAFTRERRVPIVPLLILLVPPLFWFFISWQATGNWLACFAQRQEYHDWLLRMNPAIAHFSLRNILLDGGTLLVSADMAVLLAGLFAGRLVLSELFKHRSERLSPVVQTILPAVTFFFAFLGLLLVAYVTHQQPIIFPRYGLILFALGLPLLAWTYIHMRTIQPRLARRLLIVAVVILCLDASIEFAGVVGEINRYRAQRAVADYLRDHFDPNSGAKVFCDEGTVRVLSGIPADEFLTSSGVSRDNFGIFLREKKVAYLVFASNQQSTSDNWYSDLLKGHDGRGELVFTSGSAFLPTNIGVYRLNVGR